jgi:hypothetical protein
VHPWDTITEQVIDSPLERLITEGDGDKRELVEGIRLILQQREHVSVMHCNVDMGILRVEERLEPRNLLSAQVRRPELVPL